MRAALLKRTYIGTYHDLSPEHCCHRYVEKHHSRFSNRSRHVTDRMADAAGQRQGGGCRGGSWWLTDPMHNDGLMRQ